MHSPSEVILNVLFILCVLEIVGLKNLIVTFLGLLAALAGITLSWVHGLERRTPKPPADSHSTGQLQSTLVHSPNTPGETPNSTQTKEDHTASTETMKDDAMATEEKTIPTPPTVARTTVIMRDATTTSKEEPIVPSTNIEDNTIAVPRTTTTTTSPTPPTPNATIPAIAMPTAVRPTIAHYPPVVNIGEPIQLETTLRILTDPKMEKKVSLWYTGKLTNNVLSFSEKSQKKDSAYKSGAIYLDQCQITVVKIKPGAPWFRQNYLEIENKVRPLLGNQKILFVFFQCAKDMEEWYYALERAAVFSEMNRHKQQSQKGYQQELTEPKANASRNPLHVLQQTQQQQDAEQRDCQEKLPTQHYLNTPHVDLFCNLAKVLLPDKPSEERPFNVREKLVVHLKQNSTKPAPDAKRPHNTPENSRKLSRTASLKQKDAAPSMPLFPDLPVMTGTWFSSLIHRIFWMYHEDPNFLAIIVKTLKKKFDKITLPPSFKSYTLKDVEAGPHLPEFDNIQLLNISSSGAIDLSASIKYYGGFSFTVEILVESSFVAYFFDKPVFPAIVETKVNYIQGDVIIHFSGPPSDLIWYGFTKIPKIKMSIATKVGLGEDNTSIPKLGEIFKQLLKREIKERMVSPNMDSLPFPRLPKKYQYPKQKKYVKLHKKSTFTLPEEEKDKKSGQEKEEKKLVPLPVDEGKESDPDNSKIDFSAAVSVGASLAREVKMMAKEKGYREIARQAQALMKEKGVSGTAQAAASLFRERLKKGTPTELQPMISPKSALEKTLPTSSSSTTTPSTPSTVTNAEASATVTPVSPLQSPKTGPPRPGAPPTQAKDQKIPKEAPIEMATVRQTTTTTEPPTTKKTKGEKKFLEPEAETESTKESKPAASSWMSSLLVLHEDIVTPKQAPEHEPELSDESPFSSPKPQRTLSKTKIEAPEPTITTITTTTIAATVDTPNTIAEAPVGKDLTPKSSSTSSWFQKLQEDIASDIAKHTSDIAKQADILAEQLSEDFSKHIPDEIANFLPEGSPLLATRSSRRALQPVVSGSADTTNKPSDANANTNDASSDTKKETTAIPATEDKSPSPDIFVAPPTPESSPMSPAWMDTLLTLPEDIGRHREAEANTETTSTPPTPESTDTVPYPDPSIAPKVEKEEMSDAAPAVSPRKSIADSLMSSFRSFQEEIVSDLAKHIPENLVEQISENLGKHIPEEIVSYLPENSQQLLTRSTSRKSITSPPPEEPEPNAKEQTGSAAASPMSSTPTSTATTPTVLSPRLPSVRQGVQPTKSVASETPSVWMDALLTLPEDIARHKASATIANTLGVNTGTGWIWKPTKSGKIEKEGAEEVDLFSWESDGGSNISYEESFSWTDDEEEEKSEEKDKYKGEKDKDKEKEKGKKHLPSNFWR